MAGQDPHAGPASEVGVAGAVYAFRHGIAIVSGVLAAMTVLGVMGTSGVPIGISSSRGIVALMSLVMWGVTACAGVFWALSLSTRKALSEQKLELASLAALLAASAGTAWLASLD